MTRRHHGSPRLPAISLPSRPLPIRLTNDLHQTAVYLTGKRLGDRITHKQLAHIRAKLCPDPACGCRRTVDGTFGSVYGVQQREPGVYTIELNPPISAA